MPNDTTRTMNRNIAVKRRLEDHQDDDYVPGTPAERLAMVWPLTREVLSLSKSYDVERRLQRHITRVIRRGR